jgi:hypothetical protein
MPRALNPATIANGGGLAAQKSVEASAFVHPTQGLDGLIAHIIDPSRAHEARAINLVDVGGYYFSDNVEGALQEIGGGLASSGLNGVLNGCAFTAVGLTITLATPSTVRIGTSRDLSGESITLTDNQTCWVYVDTTGTLTHTTGPSAPSFVVPENVLLWRITTSGGAITAQVDLRWFVLNIDRKMPLTVRSDGTATNDHSEASFETLEGVLIYLSQFGNLGSDDMRTHTVVIKGSMTVSNALTVPVNNVVFQGEDSCTLTTGAAFLGPGMFDISGRTGIKFRDITFACAHPAALAVTATSGAVISFYMERCFSTSAGGDWDAVVDFTASNCQRSVIRDCRFIATYPIRIEFPVDVKVLDTICLDATAGSGNVGIRLGPAAGAVGISANSQVRGCRTQNFALGISLACTNGLIEGCELEEPTTGVYLRGERVSLVSTNIQLNSFTGTLGVTVAAAGTNNGKIRGCRIENLNGAWAGAALTYGVGLTNNDNWSITDTQILGFLNTFDDTGYGVYINGAGCDRIQMSGLYIDNTQYGIYTDATSIWIKINQSQMRRVQTGVWCLAAATEITDINVEVDPTRGLVGLILEGTGIRVRGAQLITTRGVGTYGVDSPVGIVIEGSRDRISIEETYISGFFSTSSPSFGIVSASGTTGLTVQGGKIENTFTGISLESAQFARILGVDLSNTAQSIVESNGDHNVIDGCSGELNDTVGVVAVSSTGAACRIANCTFTMPRVVWGLTDNPIGIAIQGVDSAVVNCTLDGFYNPAGTDFGEGVLVASTATGAQVIGCRINNTKHGIRANAGCSAVISNNTITDVTIGVRNDSPNVQVIGCSITLEAARGIAGISTNSVEVTDCEYSGNRIDCAEVGDYGIVLTNTGGSDTYRVKMLGNTITAFSLYGIFIRGRCKQVQVSKNIIDGFIASTPTNYTPTNCIFVEGVSAVNMPRFVEVSGNTLRRARNGLQVYGVDDATLMTDITVKGNSIQHCAVGSGAAALCMGVDAFCCDTLSIQDNEITKLGVVIDDSGVESTPAAGPNVFPFAVRVRTATKLDVTTNTITDTTRAGAGISLGIYAVNSGDFGITNPFDAQSLSIVGNRLTTSSTVLPLSYGISVASGQIAAPGDTTTLTGLTIADNTMYRILYAGIIAAASGGATVTQVSITGNNISQTSDVTDGDAIKVYTIASGAFTGGILRDVVVAANNCGDIAATGIHALNDDGCALTGVSITDNTVSGAGLRCIHIRAPATAAEFTNFKVSGNTVALNTPTANAQCIRVSATDFDIKNVTVTGNTVTGPDGVPVAAVTATGSITTIAKASFLDNETFTLDDGLRAVVFAFHKTGAYVPVTGEVEVDIQTDVTSDDVRDRIITAINGVAGFNITASNGGVATVDLVNDLGGTGGNNTISDTVANAGFTHTGMSGGTLSTCIEIAANVSVLTDVAVENLVISENRLLADGEGILVFIDGILTKFVATGNQVTLSAPGLHRALRVVNDPPAPLGSEKFSGDWVVTNNNFYGGIGAYYSLNNGPKLYNTNFSNNVVAKSSGYGLLLSLLNTFSASVSALAEFTVDANTFEAGGMFGANSGVSLLFGDAVPLDNPISSVTISNNRVLFWNNTLNQPTRAINVRYNALCLGLDITGNTLDANGNAGTLVAGQSGIIEVQLGQSGVDFASRNVNISGNKFVNNFGGYGIHVSKYASATDAYLRGLRICDNEISGALIEVGIFTFYYSADAIRVDLTGFTSDASNVPVPPGDIQIDGNNIQINQHSTATVSDVGIVLIGPAAATLENVSISRNQMYRTGAGDGTTTFGAIHLDINDPIHNLRVDDNEIKNSGTNGVYADVTGATQNTSISGNLIHTPVSSGLVVTLTGAADNLTVQRNKVYDSGASGVVLNASQALQNVNITLNDIRDVTANGIVLNSTYVNESINVHIDENSILTAVIGILCEHAGGATSFAVSRNSLTTTSGAGIDIRMGYDGGETTRLFSIVGNIVKSPTGFGIEFHHDDSTGTVAGLRMDGNNISTGGSTGLYFHTGSPVITSSMSDNIVVNGSGGGLAIDLDGGVYGFKADRNILRNLNSTGMLLNFNDTTETHRVISVSDNQVYDVDSNGISLTLGNTTNAGAAAEIDISRNQIRNFASNFASTGEISGIKVYKREASLEALTISNNTLEIYIPSGVGNEHEGARMGIYLDIQAITDVVRMSVCHNNIQMTSVIDAGDIAYALRALFGGGVSPRNHVYIGNVLKLGRLERGGAAQMDYSIATSNISDDGTYDWTAFTTGWTNSVVANNIDDG